MDNAVRTTVAAPSAPEFEYHRGALGIGAAKPRLSWRVDTAPQGWHQVGYEVAVADPAGRAQTYPVDSSDSVFVPWPAAPLRSRERRSVRVRVRGADGTFSDWGPEAVVEAGLLTPADWQASMITPGVDERGPAALLRRAFSLAGEVRSARLYITAHGVYSAQVNGKRVGADALAPGWTTYAHRLRFQTSTLR